MSISLGLLAFLIVSTAVPAAAVAEIDAYRNILDPVVESGNNFTVVVNITSYQEGLCAPSLNEDLPGGWLVTPLESQNATFKASTNEWIWTEDLFIGDTKTVIYKVSVPDYTPSSIYTISGTVSAYQAGPFAVSGDTEVSVDSFINKSNLYFNQSEVVLIPDCTKEIAFVIDNLPAGLSGYNLTVYTNNSTIADIESVSFPGWAMLPRCSSTPSDSVWMKVADFGQVEAGSTNVELGKITLTGKNLGTVDVNIEVVQMDDDTGNSIYSKVIPCKVTVTVPTFPGCVNYPGDLSGDGLYEDINGNGRMDFNDVVVYYDSMDWIAGNIPVDLFDYNGNARIDFNDVVILYDTI